MIGQTISHYRIEGELGAGGMGVVYRAEDTMLKRTVALKFLPPDLIRDQESKQRFIHEAQAASRLDHSNICTVHEIDETKDGRVFICMAHYDGETVKKKIERGRLELAQALDITSQTAKGLYKAHREGIIHRDVKPANILVTTDGQVKIVDFGLAKLLGQSRLTKTGTMVGTIAYMSPEQARGDEVDHRTDIWSLGVVLFEMLSGQPPFRSDYEHAVIYSILHENPTSITGLRPEVPPEIERVVAKALAKDPGDRFKDAQELLSALDLYTSRARPETAPTPTTGDERQPSIAVLPFVNMSPDPENVYFGDGLAEELLNALTRLQGLRVAARTSAFRFRGREADIKDIGRQLNVDTVLEGSVRRAGNKLRVTAQLISIKDGYHIWSERYDREMEDIFAVQDEITLAIVEQLEVKLALRKKEGPLIKRYTENLDAYSYCLKGRFYWNSLTPEGWTKSLECFEKALECDPDYALAHAWSAIWYQSQAFWGDVSPGESYEKSKRAAKKALILDATIAEAHNFLAVLHYTHEWDVEAAEREFERSLELDPTSALAHANYSIILTAQRRFDEAEHEAELARKLDPLSSMINAWAALVYSCTGKHEAAIEQLRKAASLDPVYWQPHYHLGVAYVNGSMMEEAVPELEKAIELSGGASIALAMLTCVFYLTGRKIEAGKRFEVLKTRAQHAYVPPTFFVWIYIARGNTDRALAYLQQAADERDPWLFWYRMSPSVLRADDPRFDELLDGVGLP